MRDSFLLADNVRRFTQHGLWFLSIYSGLHPFRIHLQVSPPYGRAIGALHHRYSHKEPAGNKSPSIQAHQASEIPEQSAADKNTGNRKTLPVLFECPGYWGFVVTWNGLRWITLSMVDFPVGGIIGAKNRVGVAQTII